MSEEGAGPVAVRRPAAPDPLVLLIELADVADGAVTEAELLRRALDLHAETTGAALVAVHLFEPGAGPVPEDGDDDAVIAHLRGGGELLGVLRAPAPVATTAESELWGRVVGAGIARLRREERARELARSRERAVAAVVHRLRNATATIGVAASVVRVRGSSLEPGIRDQLLLDIEASVAILQATSEEVVDTAGGGMGRHA